MATIIKDKAIDNLWNTTSDFSWYSVTPPPASKLLKKSGDTIGTKNSKLSGTIVYFIPKDSKGKIIGKPQRLLYAGGKYILGQYVEPYYESILKNKSKWESLGANDLIALAQQKLSGSNSLSYNFSGMRVPAKTPSAYGIDAVIDLSNSNQIEEIITKPFNPLDTVVSDRYVNTNVGGYRNNSFFNNVVPSYDINLSIKEKSDVYNSRGLDFSELNLGFDGERDNEVVNLTSSAMPHGNPHNEFDLVYGVDGKHVDISSNYLGTPRSTFDIQYGVDGLSDTNKQIYTADEMVGIYNNTGSKKTFTDWLSSTNTKSVIDSLNNIVNLVNQVKDSTKTPPNSDKTNNNNNADTSQDNNNAKEETTILGMSPVTFGIVAVGALVISLIVGIHLMRKSKVVKP